MKIKVSKENKIKVKSTIFNSDTFFLLSCILVILLLSPPAYSPSIYLLILLAYITKSIKFTLALLLLLFLYTIINLDTFLKLPLNCWSFATSMFLLLLLLSPIILGVVPTVLQAASAIAL